jgi:hypothetical protein
MACLIPDSIRDEVGSVGRNGPFSPLTFLVFDCDELSARTVTKSPASRDLRSRENVLG